MTTELLLGRDQELFIAFETTQGTIVEPTATDAVLLVGDFDFSFERVYLENLEKSGSASPLQGVPARFGHGTYSFGLNARPSGSAGTAPMEANVLEAVFGKETVVGGASVTYQFADGYEPKPCTLWHKRGEWVFMYAGAKFETLGLSWSAKEIAGYKVSGGFMRMYRTGKTTVPGAIDMGASLDIVLTSGEENKYSIGSRINIAGFVGATAKAHTKAVITDIDTATHTITITKGSGDEAFDANAVISAWMPTATISGNVVSGHRGICTKDGANLVVMSAEASFNNNLEWLEDEKDGSTYCTGSVAANNRTLDASISIVARGDDILRFYEAEAGTEVAINFVAGDTAGSIVTASLPQGVFMSPAPGGSGLMELTIPIKAYASSALNDEFKIIYT